MKMRRRTLLLFGIGFVLVPLINTIPLLAQDVNWELVDENLKNVDLFHDIWGGWKAKKNAPSILVVPGGSPTGDYSVKNPDGMQFEVDVSSRTRSVKHEELGSARIRYVYAPTKPESADYSVGGRGDTAEQKEWARNARIALANQERPIDPDRWLQANPPPRGDFTFAGSDWRSIELADVVLDWSHRFLGDRGVDLAVHAVPDRAGDVDLDDLRRLADFVEEKIAGLATLYNITDTLGLFMANNLSGWLGFIGMLGFADASGLLGGEKVELEESEKKLLGPDRYCERCGAVLSPGAFFCESCGSIVGGGKPPPKPASPPPKPPPEPKPEKPPRSARAPTPVDDVLGLPDDLPGDSPSEPRFCEQCGAPTSGSMFCEQCGFALRADDDHKVYGTCPRCGKQGPVWLRCTCGGTFAGDLSQSATGPAAAHQESAEYRPPSGGAGPSGPGAPDDAPPVGDSYTDAPEAGVIDDYDETIEEDSAAAADGKAAGEAAVRGEEDLLRAKEDDVADAEAEKEGMEEDWKDRHETDQGKVHDAQDRLDDAKAVIDARTYYHHAVEGYKLTHDGEVPDFPLGDGYDAMADHPEWVEKSIDHDIEALQQDLADLEKAKAALGPDPDPTDLASIDADIGGCQEEIDFLKDYRSDFTSDLSEYTAAKHSVDEAVENRDDHARDYEDDLAEQEEEIEALEGERAEAEEKYQISKEEYQEEVDWLDETKRSYEKACGELRDYLHDHDPANDPDYHANVKRLRAEVQRTGHEVNQAQNYLAEREIAVEETELDYYRDMLKGDLRNLLQEEKKLEADIAFYEEHDPATAEVLKIDLGKIRAGIERAEKEWTDEFGPLPEFEVREVRGPQFNEGLQALIDDMHRWEGDVAALEEFEQKLKDIDDPALELQYDKIYPKIHRPDGTIDWGKLEEFKGWVAHDSWRQSYVGMIEDYGADRAFMDTMNQWADHLTRLTPGVNLGRSFVELYTGENVYTGEEITAGGHLWNFGTSVLSLAGPLGKLDALAKVPGLETGGTLMDLYFKGDLAHTGYQWATGQITTVQAMEKGFAATYGLSSAKLGFDGPMSDPVADPDGPPGYDRLTPAQQAEWDRWLAGMKKGRANIREFENLRAERYGLKIRLNRMERQFGRGSAEFQAVAKDIATVNNKLYDQTVLMNGDYQTKLILKGANPQLQAEFDGQVGRIYKKTDAVFRQKMKEAGYTDELIEKFRDFRNAKSAGTVGMDRDFGITGPQAGDYAHGANSPQFRKDLADFQRQMTAAKPDPANFPGGLKDPAYVKANRQWRQDYVDRQPIPSDYEGGTTSAQYIRDRALFRQSIVTVGGKKIPIRKALGKIREIYDESYEAVTGADPEAAFQAGGTHPWDVEAYGNLDYLQNRPELFDPKWDQQAGDVSGFKVDHNYKLAEAGRGGMDMNKAAMESVRGWNKDLSQKIIPYAEYKGATLPPRIQKIVSIFRRSMSNGLPPSQIEAWIQRDTGLSLTQAMNELRDLMPAIGKLKSGPALS